MLKNLPDLIYSPLGMQESIEVKCDGQTLSAGSPGASQTKWTMTLKESATGAELELLAQPRPETIPSTDKKSENKPAKLVAAEYLFGHYRNIHRLVFDQSVLSREEYAQQSSLWTRENLLTAEHWIHTGEVFHPLRPRPRPGVCYRRYIPETGRTLTFRLAEVDRDLAAFHQWHNQDRVADFWELKKSAPELREYLEKGLADPHQIPLIMEFDGEAAGYFEVYWVAEDRLGPYYESEAFDRGFHFLIGNEKFLGFENTDAALRSICHFIFLDDPRTRKIMAEPRSDNGKVLRYVETFKAWKKLKEFDFPHKRAALLECRREKFFSQGSI